MTSAKRDQNLLSFLYSFSDRISAQRVTWDVGLVFRTFIFTRVRTQRTVSTNRNANGTRDFRILAHPDHTHTHETNKRPLRDVGVNGVALSQRVSYLKILRKNNKREFLQFSSHSHIVFYSVLCACTRLCVCLLAREYARVQKYHFMRRYCYRGRARCHPLKMSANKSFRLKVEMQ